MKGGGSGGGSDGDGNVGGGNEGGGTQGDAGIAGRCVGGEENVGRNGGVGGVGGKLGTNAAKLSSTVLNPMNVLNA